MFSVRPADIERLRSPGGDRFASFVNDVIFAHALACGSPASEVHLNLQTNIGDGGVDAEVSAAANDPLGWLSYPSAWQFKASTAANAGPAALVQDIKKEFAARRVSEGYIYYACICDHLTQAERSRREDELLQAAQEINPAAQTPHVLDVNDLATLSSRYPAVVLKHFRPEVEGLCLSLDAWRPNAEGATRHYVRDPKLNDVQARIESHLTLASTPRDAVLLLRGESGVGKTRLAFEAVTSIPGADALVVFAADEQAASRLANLFANRSLSAILVADEMTSEGVAQIRAALDGHRDRVRIVAIESAEDDYRRDDDGAVWIPNVSTSTLDEILDANFPQVVRERRRAYAYLAEGAIRFAVELCRRDAEIALEPGLPRAAFVREYVGRLLADHEKDSVDAVALVYGVGWRDEVAEELQRLCVLLGLDADRVRRSANRVREAPGFIATAGRYWYVKPPIVARVAFNDAWQRWAAHNEDDFLERVAASGLLKPFLRQVGRIAADDVRRRVGEYWRDWAGGLTPECFRTHEILSQLLDLVEITPELFLPVLQRLVDQATDEVLTYEPSWSPGQREGRHELVKLARRFAALPRHFHDAESILLRLALAESQPRISPNATGTYKQLFKVFLSGTTLPFDTRLSALSQRIRGEEAAALLAIDTLCAILDPHHHRGVDDPIVAGHIASEDWQPDTHNGWHECLVLAVDELKSVIANGSQTVKERTWGALLPRLGTLAESGFATSLGALFPDDMLTTHVRKRFVIELRTYLESLEDLEDKREWRRLISEEDEQELRNLILASAPVAVQERLGILLESDFWQSLILEADSSWRLEARAIAAKLLQNPMEFEAAQQLLFSTSLMTVQEFGRELGGQDLDGAFLEAALNAAFDQPPASFTIGYIQGLAEKTSKHSDRIERFLADADEQAPLLAFQLAYTIEGLALERMLRLVDQDQVPALHLRMLAHGLNGRRLTDEEREQILERLATAAERQEPEAAYWGVVLLHRWLPAKADAIEREKMLRRERLANVTWRLIEADMSSEQRPPGLWSDILRDMAAIDPTRAARSAANALCTGNGSLRSVASEVLIALVDSEPELVMAELGRVMLDPEQAFSATVHSHSSVIEALPHAVMERWLEANGREGAIALAWHVPRPFVAPRGQAEIPRLTEIVLARFGQDEEVFDAFCRASVSESRFVVEMSGEGLARRRHVAEQVQVFEAHPNERIRAWAREVQRRVDDYERWMSDSRLEDDEHRFR